jgi:hypothetical protein
MDTLIHADIFFFITTTAVIVVAIGLLWVIFYVVRILRNVERISIAFRKGTEGMADSIEAIGKNLKNSTAPDKIWNKIISFFLPNFNAKKKSGKKAE